MKKKKNAEKFPINRIEEILNTTAPPDVSTKIWNFKDVDLSIQEEISFIKYCFRFNKHEILFKRNALQRYSIEAEKFYIQSAFLNDKVDDLKAYVHEHCINFSNWEVFAFCCIQAQEMRPLEILQEIVLEFPTDVQKMIDYFKEIKK